MWRELLLCDFSTEKVPKCGDKPVTNNKNLNLNDFMLYGLFPLNSTSKKVSKKGSHINESELIITQIFLRETHVKPIIENKILLKSFALFLLFLVGLIHIK